MDGIKYSYTGIPIIVIPKKKQCRTHKKNRINKKWTKRYGFVGNNCIDDDKVIYMGGKLYVNDKTFQKIKKDKDYEKSMSEKMMGIVKDRTIVIDTEKIPNFVST